MIWMKKCNGLTLRWLMLKDPYAFHRAWFPTRLHFGDPATYQFQMDCPEAIYRAVEKYPEWRVKHQWLLRGRELLDLLGEEEVQWFYTKFNTVSGVVRPFFELEEPENEFAGQTHRKIIQRRALPISDSQTSKKLVELYWAREYAHR